MTSSKALSPWEAAPSWAVNPMTPAKREAFRTEVQRKQERASQASEHKLGKYQESRVAASKPVHVISEADALTNPHAQALCQLSGQLPTPASQQSDRGVANVNTLRFQRAHRVISGPQRDGGRTYNPLTLEANWVEETRDKHYKTPWHAKELRRSQLWDTEFTANYTIPPDNAPNRIKTLLVAEPEPGLKLDVKPTGESSKDWLYYAQEGFGQGKHQDHTSVAKRGGHWLGVAPVLDGKESIATTAFSRGQFLEFQMRTPTTDTKAKLLGTLPGGLSLKNEPADPWREKAAQDLSASQRFATAWVSSYKRDFTRFPTKESGPLRPTTCVGSFRPFVAATAAPANSQPAA